jgi:hypothetical protein
MCCRPVAVSWGVWTSGASTLIVDTGCYAAGASVVIDLVS